MRGFVIHSRDWVGAEAVQVADRWMVSSSHDILRAIGEGRGPSRWLVALGYAGWSPGQLEGEMVRHGWHVTPGSDGLLFETPPAERWQAAFAEAGVDARLLTTEGGEASRASASSGLPVLRLASAVRAAQREST